MSSAVGIITHNEIEQSLTLLANISHSVIKTLSYSRDVSSCILCGTSRLYGGEVVAHPTGSPNALRYSRPVRKQDDRQVGRIPMALDIVETRLVDLALTPDALDIFGNRNDSWMESRHHA